MAPARGPRRYARVQRRARAAACAAAVLGLLVTRAARTGGQPGGDPVAQLLSRLEIVLQAGAAGGLQSLLSPNVAPGLVDRIAPRLFSRYTTRVVLREREREALEGALPGDGYRLGVEALIEAGISARIVTARLDVRRAPGDEASDAWGIVDLDPVSVVDGLHRLMVDETQQFAARNLILRAEDLTLTLPEGTVYPVKSGNGTAGLVLMGQGRMEFTPAPPPEREQLRLFAGAETLNASFETAFVRLNPIGLRRQRVTASLQPVAVDPRLLRRAREIFAVEAPKAFGLDLGDLSREQWYLVPPIDDFLAEVRTRGLGTLTYARSSAEAEDVTLFERAKGRDIARYASAAKVLARGVFYNDDDLSEYDVLDYEIDLSLNPVRESVDGRARLRINVRSPVMSTVSLRLADPLSITSAYSPQLGRLLHLRVRTRDTVVLNLPVALRRGRTVTLDIAYSGRLKTQSIDQESLALQQPDLPSGAEPYYLLSSKGYWYPQPSNSDYATATLRVTVPEEYACTASGVPVPGFRAAVTSTGDPAKVYVYRATEPVRYLALLVARLRNVATEVVPLTDDLGPETPRLSTDGARLPGFRVRDRVSLSTEAVPRLRARGRQLHAWATDIVRFYASIMGDVPYGRLTVDAVEHQVPGGHGPAYFVLLNTPAPGSQIQWRNDPAYFDGYPEYFLAHEIAHQWWGQTVGWKNYHEQWLSEAFAQYFAALYARERRGDEMYVQMLRQFRRWSLEHADQGPVYLGYRLGHIRGDRRIFRSIVYNKGAAVLHMLRRLVGDEAFFNGLRRLYYDKKFEKAGTDDVRRAFEAESGRSLERFFDRWIFESRMPRVQVRSTIGDREVLVRFRQLDDALFDVPVTVTLTYVDGRAVDVLVPITEQVVERTIPTDGAVRSVRINRDSAALATFEES